jgi:molybdopterin/thiamine biosynthesis adenylyltransferase
VTGCIQLRLTGTQHDQLHHHLFPGDGDEHGAVILAGVTSVGDDITLVARDIVLARDGIDYVAGERGYRMLTAGFVNAQSDRAAREGLAYIAVHCHGGTSTVGLSPDDRRSQQRGYPALLDILDGPPVAGAVFALEGAAGDLWLPGQPPKAIDRVVVSGPNRLVLTPHPTIEPAAAARYGRQALMFGDAGQNILASLTVAVIGCGGIGSIVVELLAKLGVGHLILIDPDHVTTTNLPRLIDATDRDARSWLTDECRPRWMRRLGARLATKKVRLAARVARRANPHITITEIPGDVTDDSVAKMLLAADYLMLAADSFHARLVANAVAFQHGIPGYQLGAKVRVDESTGDVIDVYSVVRPFGPEHGCLWCNGLIPPERLASEAVPAEQRRAQRYVDDDAVEVPSVITLNSVAASHAANELLLYATGLRRHDRAHRYVTFRADAGDIEWTVPRQDAACPECGDGSRRARGDSRALPTNRL